MPTKCLKAENSFDIDKCMIISLEGIDFQIISIITDNNAIDKKLYLAFSVPKASHCISTPSYKIFTSFLPIQLSSYIKMH